MKGFKQSYSDPCMFRRLVCGEDVALIVVHVNDVRLASKRKDDEERAISILCSCFRLEDLAKEVFYLGCHIARNIPAALC